jgi:hypothetical protein
LVPTFFLYRRYFVSKKVLLAHFKNKVHKRRLKQVQEEQYTQEEANHGAGMGATDNGLNRSSNRKDGATAAAAASAVVSDLKMSS